MILPHQNAAFVCQMEPVLAVYQRAYDLARPQRLPERVAQAIAAREQAAMEVLVTAGRKITIKPKVLFTNTFY